jgi:hypothetical protein
MLNATQKLHIAYYCGLAGDWKLINACQQTNTTKYDVRINVACLETPLWHNPSFQSMLSKVIQIITNRHL